MNVKQFTKIASLGLLVAFANTAFAEEELIEEVVVTGSYIKGSPQDAELPIDVITEEDMLQMGSPSMIEMIRNLGVTAANLGETNQFTTGGQANEGMATVNLRGLGASRTLVLLNGRRHVSSEIDGVDISAFPISAIGRVEVLKDGAAALYGSDAIAGVANFITRGDFEGLEVGGSFKDIDGSDGDWDMNAIFGTSGDKWSFMIAGEYSERGELPIKERDWALVNTDVNAPAGWSGIGNPGTDQFFPTVAPGTADFTVTDADGNVTTQNLAYAALNDDGSQATVTKTFADPQCEALGALRAVPAACGFNYAWFDNLIEQQENTKVYSELNIDLSDNHRLHFEAMYSDVDIPAWKTSPSYPPQSLFGPDRRMNTDHPGLVDFNSFYDLQATGNAGALTAANIGGLATGLAEGSTAELAAGDAAAAALAGDPTALTIGRVMGVSGAFLTGQPEAAQRQTETTRFVVGLDGTLFNDEVNYDVSVSYSKRDRTIGGQDMYVERMGLALKGYGGAGCTLPATTTAADGSISFTDPTAAAAAAGVNGCEYYNPFSRAVPFSYVNNTANADYNPEVANSVGLLEHMIGQREANSENELLVFQAVFSGMTNIEVGGGTVGYAFGAQSRNQEFNFRLSSLVNRAVNPCPYTEPAAVALGIVDADQLSPNCSSPTGVAAFLAATDEQSNERTVYGVFGELAIPLTDDVDIQAAVRFEDYGGNVGSSIDPKIAATWRITEELSLRGSASTTFRGPPQSLLSGKGTALSYVGPTASFKAIDTIGNPQLSSEEAVSTNIGLIYQNESFYASIDYWSFTFEDSFQREGFNQLLGAYSANDCIDDGAAVDNATCNTIGSHIFPVAARSNLASTERIEVNWLNGTEIKTSGIDFKAEYTFSDVMNGSVSVGVDGTYGLEYERDAGLDVSGSVVLAPAADLMGQLNYNAGPSFTSKPELKLAAHLTYENDAHYGGLVVRHVGEYDDTGAPARLAALLGTIDDHTTYDLNYVYRGFDGLTLSASVVNLTDEDPATSRGDLAYDPFTHNAFGRMMKVGFTYTLMGE
jgi:outer membrane receptor protein involved in Fe transport